jgi:hypothetical protein
MSDEFTILGAMIGADDGGEDVASAARAAAKHLTHQQYGRVIARLAEAGWIRAMIQQNGGGEYSVVYPEAVLMKGRTAVSQDGLAAASGGTVNVVGSVIEVLNLGTIGRADVSSSSSEETGGAA